MKREMFAAAMELAEKRLCILVGTADAKGLPHLAAAGDLSSLAAGRISVKSWFCPGTVANLKANRCIAVVVWDPSSDEGFQLLGEVEEVRDRSILDGYAPEVETVPPPPQVERELLVRVDKVIRFSHAPHSDVEE